MVDSMTLSNAQSKALLDVLSHYEVYQEIHDFRLPGTLDAYGPPFRHKPGQPSTTPSLQTLVTTFLTTLPGFRDVSQDFYRTQIETIISDLEKAELSESYDKGNLGIRKTLATAIAALLEYVVRGVYAGFNRPDAVPKAELDPASYDTTSAQDLQRAFRDCMQQAVYGNIINEIFDKTAQTDKLSEHSALVQASHEFGLVNFASLLHFALIKSPKGQQLLALIDHANKLIPYTILRQTLKIGNVASMLNAMIKVVLAKVSLSTVTNWMGLTQGGDEGMNLLQSIINQVLQWDNRDFKSRSTKIEKSKDGPSKDQLKAIKDYIEKPREVHEKLRETSITKSQSIVYVILQDASISTTLTESSHRQALDYLSIHLSIRDRTEIIRVLCRSNPDNLTQSVRDLVAAYEPLIRSVHNSVDLSDTVSDFEAFIKDLVRLARLPDPAKQSSRRGSIHQPTVGDFVAFLRKHQYSSHKFLHQVAKNGKDITQWFRDWANTVAKRFQQDCKPSEDGQFPGAGDLTPGLQRIFDDLPDSKRAQLLQILDHNSTYIEKLHYASAIRLRNVVASPQSDLSVLNAPDTPTGSGPPSRASSPGPSTGRRFFGSKSSTNSAATTPTTSHDEAAAGRINPGPGAYLARWQALLDTTLMTPTEATGGQVRGTGSLPRATAEAGGTPGRRESEDDGDDDDDDNFQDAYERLDQFSLDEGERVAVPDVRPVVEALAQPFRSLLAERGCTW